MATSNMFPKANAKHLHDGEDFAVEFSDLRDSFKQQSGEGNNLGPFGLDGHARRTMGAGAAALMPLFVGVATASAKGGAFGIIEGRTASFLHPIIMVRSGPLCHPIIVECSIEHAPHTKISTLNFKQHPHVTD